MKIGLKFGIETDLTTKFSRSTSPQLTKATIKGNNNRIFGNWIFWLLIAGIMFMLFIVFFLICYALKVIEKDKNRKGELISFN